MVTLTEKEQLARNKLCLPLDMDNLEAARDLSHALHEYVGLFKIGKELFTSEGPDAIRTIQSEGGDVFLDLKYHDIPNTVQGATRVAVRHGVKLLNVHASGGLPMLEAAMKGIREGVSKYGKDAPQVVGVTVLTSFDEARYLQTFQPLNPALDDIDFSKYCDMKKDDETLQKEFRELLELHNLTGVIGKQVLHLARLTERAGLNGIVSSAADLYAVRPHLPEIVYVTPGIQAPTGFVGADQRRVFSPYNAIKDGATILVVGRAITQPPHGDIQKAAYEVLQDMVKAM